MEQTEADLETFRQRWREEVNARINYKPSSSRAPGFSYNPHYEGRFGPPPSSRPPAGKQKQEDKWEEFEPQSYHDIEPRESGHRLGDATSSTSQKKVEPSTALEHYEEAVQKETIGKLGDSVKLYRKAFKLDDKVHESYKAKHFPAASFPPKSKVSHSTNNTQPSSKPGSTAPNTLTGLSNSLTDLLSDFASLTIQGADPPTDLSPPLPCPIAQLPEEILSEIMLYTALRDVASFARLAQVCKRMAYLVLTSDLIWRRIASGPEFGFAAIHYRWACQVNGDPLFDSENLLGPMSDDDDDPDDHDVAPAMQSLVPRSLVPHPYPNHRALFRSRPRIRFNGCYICTVNYTRAGAAAPTHATWSTPVHIVTYYRYLRFFRNGTVISLLTTAEPADVVHQLTWENVRPRIEKGDKTHRAKHENPNVGTGTVLPHTFMKDALPGRWRLSGPDGESNEYSAPSANQSKASSSEGTLYIETEGVPRKYDFKMNLAISSAGRGARNNKLSWLGHWSYNKTTDDWAEFGLKHDKPYYWSRVKSFGVGMMAGREE